MRFLNALFVWSRRVPTIPTSNTIRLNPLVRSRSFGTIASEDFLDNVKANASVLCESWEDDDREHMNFDVRATKNFIMPPSIPAFYDYMWENFTEAQIVQGINALSPLLVDRRVEKMHNILNSRTNSVRMVFENPSNPSNVWAALRTFDCFGVQYADIIFDPSTYSSGKSLLRKNMMTSMGSHKWMTLRTHTSTKACFDDLKAQGFRIYATDLHSEAKKLPDLKIDSKAVFVLGTESTGISEEARKNADELVYIPMRGFAESLNMSATCAILCSYLEMKGLFQPNLDRMERNRILLTWLARSFGSSHKILHQCGLLTPSCDSTATGIPSNLTQKQQGNDTQQ